jgi:hypothetical protein
VARVAGTGGRASLEGKLLHQVCTDYVGTKRCVTYGQEDEIEFRGGGVLIDHTRSKGNRLALTRLSSFRGWPRAARLSCWR